MTSGPTAKRKTISGAIAPGALGTAARLFDQSVRTIAAELLQNGRRAGATRIDVAIENGPEGLRAAFSDDGRGVDDLQALVDLGRSGWDAGETAVEDWAGMGVFSMANRGCTIDSLGKRVAITTDVFAGRAEAVPQTAPFRQGTRVAFPIAHEAEARELTKAVEAEARHGPVPVWLHGTEVPRVAFISKAIEIGTHAGVRIGLELTEEGRRGRDGHDMNFGGHTLSTGTSLDVRLPQERARLLWDVGEGSTVKLTLPTRDKVVADGDWADLLLASQNMAYAAISRLFRRRRQPNPLTRAQADQARAGGYDIPTKEVRLIDFAKHHGLVEAWDNLLDEVDTALLAPERCSDAGLMAACMALLTGGSPLRVAQRDRGCEGVPEYDAIPRIEGVTLIVTTKGGARHEIERFEQAGSSISRDQDDGLETFCQIISADRRGKASDRIAKIEVSLQVIDANGLKSVIGPHEISFAYMKVDYHATETRVMTSPRMRANQIGEAAAMQQRFGFDEREQEGMDEIMGEGWYTAADHRTAIWWQMARQRLRKRDLDLHEGRLFGTQLAKTLSNQASKAGVAGFAIDVARAAGAATVSALVVRSDGIEGRRTFQVQPKPKRKQDGDEE